MTRRGVVVVWIVILNLLIVWPVGAARRVEVDVVFLVDTSDSMADELGALCRGVAEVVDEMDGRGVTVNEVVLGIAETRACAREQLSDLIPDAQTKDKEDWGLAVVDLARHHEWTPDAARLIVLLSDEGPLQGDPVDDDDERTIWMAIRAARAGEVMVSPVLGTEFNSEVELLARDLAQETGGRVFISRDPDADLAAGLRELIQAAANRARANTTVLEAIPTPRDLVFTSQVVSTNLALAILLTLVMGVASTVLSDVLGGSRTTFDASRLGRLAGTVGNLGRAVERFFSPGEWSGLSPSPRRLLIVIQLGLFGAVMAFLSLFLQPDLSPLSWRGLGMGLGMLLALLLMNLVYDGGQYWLARRAGAAPIVRLQPTAPLATLVGVLASRTAGFVPGFFYGRATRCTLPSGEAGAGLSPWWRPRVVLIGLVVVAIAGLGFWLLTVPTSLLLEFIEGLDLSKTLDTILTGLVGTVQGFFLLCFFVAWQTLLFELLPFPSTGGGIVYRRSRLIWAVVAFGVLFVLLQALVNPFGTPGELLESRGLVMLLISLFLYSTLAVGVWLLLTLRTGGMAVADWERGQRTTVLAISLMVLWVLAACSGLVLLVARWLG